MRMPLRSLRMPVCLAMIAWLALTLAACGSGDPAQEGEAQPSSSGELTIYSGRGESLVGPLIERFEQVSGIDVRIRYAGTAELASAILEEGDRSRVDVFYSQDAGALAALAEGEALRRLPDEIVASVPGELADADGHWVATSGRARVLIVSTERVPDPPESVFDLVHEEWRGRVGWAPTNASFQAFVTAMRQIHGDDATEEWLRGMLANDVVEYPRNSPVVQAVGDGEIDVGLVNHYYLFRFLADDPEFQAMNHFTDPGAAGGLVNVAGVAVLKASRNTENALSFVRFLLSEEGQLYFRDQTSEYPVASEIDARPELVPLSQLNPPSLALTSLSDLEGTLELLRDAGVLP